VLFAATLVAAVAVAAPVARQTPSPAQRAAPYTLVTRDGRRALAVVRAGGQDMFRLDELAAVFGLTVREDTLAGGLTISLGGQTIVLSPGQNLASVGGRLISLPAPAVREGDAWLVPVDFVSRALGPVSATRIDLRKPSRLVVVGDLTVPRVDVRLDAEGDARARLTFEVSPATPHTVSQENGRLLVSFDADALDPRLGAIRRGPIVAGVTAEPGAPAVAIDLGPAFASYRAVDVEGGAGAGRFVVELVGATPEPPPAAPPPEAPPATPPPGAPPQPPEPGATPLGDRTAAGEIRTIVIDPGHGGSEDGARGANGTLEKDVTLAVARRLESAIERRLGIRVILTRDGDETVALDARAERANNNKADLFVSLHANASTARAAAGAEVFYLGLEEYGGEAERAARTSGVALPVFGGGTRDIELIPWELAQARYLDRSAALAGLVENELRQRVPMSPRARQQGPFRVLVGANMPAVLVEMGFLTNPDEERALTSEPFQNAVVQALVESIIRFRDATRGRED